jgi:hypothetical protein
MLLYKICHYREKINLPTYKGLKNIFRYFKILYRFKK